MNPANLNEVSLLAPTQAEISGALFKPLSGDKSFLSTMEQIMGSTKEIPSHTQTFPLEKRVSPQQEYQGYLESLRKGLIGKGKPLDRTFLKHEDLPLLRQFLYQLGFSEERVERCLKELVEKNPNRGIDFSQFFRKINELSPPKGKLSQQNLLDASLVPYVESALRSLDFTPEEMARALKSARLEGGGLDLDRFILRVKAIVNQRPNAEGRLKLDQFVKDLEKMASRQIRGAEGKMASPDEVRATMEKMWEKAVTVKEEEKLRVMDSSNLEQVGKERKLRVMDPSNLEHSGNEGKREHVGKEEKREEKSAGALKEHPDMDSSLAAIKNRSMRNPDNPDHGKRPKEPVMEAKLEARPETGKVDIPHNPSSTSFHEVINAVRQDQKPVGGVLPSYLVDQVGRQIARSILIGDNVIHLRLRPPELGAVKVQMELSENSLKLGMVTENSSVKDLLLANIHELRDALVEQGVKIDRIDIQIQNGFGQALANSQETPREGQGRAGQQGEAAPSEGEDMDDHAEIRSDHLLDLMA